MYCTPYLADGEVHAYIYNDQKKQDVKSTNDQERFLKEHYLVESVVNLEQQKMDLACYRKIICQTL